MRVHNSHLKDNVRNVMLTKCHNDKNRHARSYIYVNTSIKLGSQTLPTTLISFWCRTTSIKYSCACAMDTKIKNDTCDSLLKFCLYCLGSYNKNSTVFIINNYKYVLSLFLNMKTVYMILLIFAHAQTYNTSIRIVLSIFPVHICVCISYLRLLSMKHSFISLFYVWQGEVVAKW